MQRKKFIQRIKPTNLYADFTERYPTFGPRFETPVTKAYSKFKTFSEKYLLPSSIFIFSILVLLAYITTSSIIHRFRNKASLEKQEKLDEHLEDQSQLTVIFLGIIGCVILVYLLYLMTHLNMTIEDVKEKVQETTKMLNKQTLPVVKQTGQAVTKASKDVSDTLKTAQPLVQAANKNVPGILKNANENLQKFELPAALDKDKNILGGKKGDGYLGWGLL